MVVFDQVLFLLSPPLLPCRDIVDCVGLHLSPQTDGVPGEGIVSEIDSELQRRP